MPSRRSTTRCFWKLSLTIRLTSEAYQVLNWDCLLARNHNLPRRKDRVAVAARRVSASRAVSRSLRGRAQFLAVDLFYLTGLLESKLFRLQLFRHSLGLPHRTQEVAAQNLTDLLFRVPAI